MPTTPNLALPYPLGSATPDVAGDIFSLATRLDLLGATGTISYPGTVSDFGAAFVSGVRRAFGIGVLVVACNPHNTANATLNNLLLNSSIKPFMNTPGRLALYNPGGSGGWSGAFMDVVFNTDGSLSIAYASANAVNGSGLLGAIPFLAV